MILKYSFFQQDTFLVAENLLGCFLVKRRKNRKIEKYMITEVEVYDGFRDRASHASKGKTKRNEIMFEEGGNWYVYLVYGMHNMLNITTSYKDNPAAILIRGVENIRGPGRLTKKLEINRSFNKLPANKKTNLWIEDIGVEIKEENIEKTPRIGVAYAGKWAKAPYRFVLK